MHSGSSLFLRLLAKLMDCFRVSLMHSVLSGLLAPGLTLSVHGAAPASGETVNMAASLSAKSEVPPVDSNRTDSVTIKSDRKRVWRIQMACDTFH
jgi:hypothetical protein